MVCNLVDNEVTCNLPDALGGVISELLRNRLLVYDRLNMKFTEFKAKIDPDCENCNRLVSQE